MTDCRLMRLPLLVIVACSAACGASSLSDSSPPARNSTPSASTSTWGMPRQLLIARRDLPPDWTINQIDLRSNRHASDCVSQRAAAAVPRAQRVALISFQSADGRQAGHERVQVFVNARLARSALAVIGQAVRECAGIASSSPDAPVVRLIHRSSASLAYKLMSHGRFNTLTTLNQAGQVLASVACYCAPRLSEELSVDVSDRVRERIDGLDSPG